MSAAFLGLRRDDLVFSLKTYAAACLALWIALELDLQRPYWAMATAYIVAQPYAGAVASKAVFRVIGTFVGAAVALILVPALVDVPELLCLALALWVGACLFVSLLDRTPRSYVSMLAGYTAAIVAFPAVNAPDGIFDTALSRGEEITIGILTTALISRLVAPRAVGPQLAGRLEAWMTDAGRWAGDVLTGRPDRRISDRDRMRLATDTVDMLALTTHLPWDTSPFKWVGEQIRALQHHMTALLPILSSLDDRLGEARVIAALPAEVSALVGDVADWIAGTSGDAGDAADRLAARVRACEDAVTAKGGETWSDGDVETLSLLARLRELIEVWAACLVLRADVAAGRPRPPTPLRSAERYSGPAALHVDLGMASLSALGVVVGILITCAFWIATGWQDGAGAALMTAVFFSLFAFMDDPVPVMRLFAGYTALATVVAGFHQFVIWPHVDGLPLLVLTSAPLLIVGGALTTSRRWGPIGFLLCVNLPLATLLQARPSVDVVAFLDNNLASIVGLVAATSVAAVIGSVGAEAGVARLVAANRRDLAGLAEGRRAVDTSVFVRRLVDRFGLAVQRMVALPADLGFSPVGVLAELRVGLDVADLRRVLADLPPTARTAVTDLLDGLGRHFRARPPFGVDEAETARLVAHVDLTLAALATPRDDDAARLLGLRALAGIRRGLAAIDGRAAS
ncbi:MAG: FUSC family protein [Phyllobacteriaceae bacterium]|nr:FUSC family protein [Phyllobacteriaceae bacterium]